MRPRPGSGPKLVRVDAKLRDHGHWTRVALRAQDVARLGAAGDGILRGVQAVPFPPAKGRGIRPHEVLPRKEQSPRFALRGLAHRQARGEVVRLLVDVDDVRPKRPQQVAQSGEVEQVKVSIETCRQHAQAVAPQMGALKRLATAVLQPVWGNDAGQLYIGLPRQLLELALVGAYHAGFGDHDDLHAAAWAYTFMVCIATAPQENRAARARA